MAYLNLHEVATHPDFIRIVKMAILKQAAAVAGEDSTNLQAVVATKRQNLANQVFANATHQAREFSFHIATYGGDVISVDANKVLVYTGNGDIDSAIDNLIDTVWNDRAGVTYLELNPVV